MYYFLIRHGHPIGTTACYNEASMALLLSQISIHTAIQLGEIFVLHHVCPQKKILYKCHGFVYFSMLKRIQELNCPFPQMSLDEIPNFPGDKRCFLGEISMFHHFSHGFIMFHPICPMFSLEFSIQTKNIPIRCRSSSVTSSCCVPLRPPLRRWRRRERWWPGAWQGLAATCRRGWRRLFWGRKWPNWENLVRRCVCFFGMAKVGMVVNIWILLFLKNDEFSRFMLKRFDERQWTRPQSPNFARNGRNQNYYPTELLSVDFPDFTHFMGIFSEI